MRTIDPSIILAAIADVKHVAHVTSRDLVRRRPRPTTIPTIPLWVELPTIVPPRV
jgi:hypothetical protein